MVEIDGFAGARRAVLEKALERAPFEGWTRPMLSRAAADAGVDRAAVAAAFPQGIADVLRLWSAQLDDVVREALAGPELATLRVREKVAIALQARLAALRPHKEAARRAAATLTLPFYGALGPHLLWNTADTVWRGLNDTSVDINFYSKRAILSVVWASTFGRWLADDDPRGVATNEFLARRIDNVMEFEKLKARASKLRIDPAKPLSRLARLRYPAG